MESGLRDRNNIVEIKTGVHNSSVSMESGLRDRNNFLRVIRLFPGLPVSMKSGLRDRNNDDIVIEHPDPEEIRLNEVRP